MVDGRFSRRLTGADALALFVVILCVALSGARYALLPPVIPVLFEVHGHAVVFAPKWVVCIPTLAQVAVCIFTWIAAKDPLSFYRVSLNVPRWSSEQMTEAAGKMNRNVRMISLGALLPAVSAIGNTSDGVGAFWWSLVVVASIVIACGAIAEERRKLLKRGNELQRFDYRI